MTAAIVPEHGALPRHARQFYGPGEELLSALPEARALLQDEAWGRYRRRSGEVPLRPADRILAHIDATDSLAAITEAESFLFLRRHNDVARIYHLTPKARSL